MELFLFFGCLVLLHLGRGRRGVFRASGAGVSGSVSFFSLPPSSSPLLLSGPAWVFFLFFSALFRQDCGGRRRQVRRCTCAAALLSFFSLSPGRPPSPLLFLFLFFSLFFLSLSLSLFLSLLHACICQEQRGKLHCVA